MTKIFSTALRRGVKLALPQADDLKEGEEGCLEVKGGEEGAHWRV